MKHEIPKFKQPGVEYVERLPLFAQEKRIMPKLDYPISPLENFKLSYMRKGPRWVPNVALDFDNMMIGIRDATAPPMDRTQRSDFKDAYGVWWTWVPEAGGPMLKPGTIFLDDVTKWREKVTFPDYKKAGWEELSKDFMENTYSPERVVHINIGQGATERLVGLLGGYTEFLVSLMVEPEACKDFFDAFADYTVGLLDYLFECFPVINMITYHDDWGTEKDTFFSEQIMEDLLLDATKKVVACVKKHGACFELHSCGRVERFFPYMIEAGVDLVQMQSRANDMVMLKAKYGDKIGFNFPIENTGPEFPTPSREDYMKYVRQTIDKYASNGGLYLGFRTDDDEILWEGTYEMFYYSQEFYDKEQGRN